MVLLPESVTPSADHMISLPLSSSEILNSITGHDYSMYKEKTKGKIPNTTYHKYENGYQNISSAPYAK
jgi:hypothetical protein